MCPCSVCTGTGMQALRVTSVMMPVAEFAWHHRGAQLRCTGPRDASGDPKCQGAPVCGPVSLIYSSTPIAATNRMSAGDLSQSRRVVVVETNIGTQVRASDGMRAGALGARLSVARRPTGTQVGPGSRRPQAHSLSSMLSMRSVLAACARSLMRMVLLMSKCSTRRAFTTMLSWGRPAPPAAPTSTYLRPAKLGARHTVLSWGRPAPPAAPTSTYLQPAKSGAPLPPCCPGAGPPCPPRPPPRTCCQPG